MIFFQNDLGMLFPCWVSSTAYSGTAFLEITSTGFLRVRFHSCRQH